MFEAHIEKLEKKLAVQSSGKMLNDVSVQGDFKHICKEKPKPEPGETAVKDLKGPSVTAGIFYTALDHEKEDVTIPKPKDERNALFERVDSDFEESDS